MKLSGVSIQADVFSYVAILLSDARSRADDVLKSCLPSFKPAIYDLDCYRGIGILASAY